MRYNDQTARRFSDSQRPNKTTRKQRMERNPRRNKTSNQQKTGLDHREKHRTHSERKSLLKTFHNDFLHALTNVLLQNGLRPALVCDQLDTEVWHSGEIEFGHLTQDHSDDLWTHRVQKRVHLLKCESRVSMVLDPSRVGRSAHDFSR